MATTVRPRTPAAIDNPAYQAFLSCGPRSSSPRSCSAWTSSPTC